MNRYFKQAELALAAYSTLSSDMLIDKYREALVDGGKGLSFSQAEFFADTYRVVDQHTDATGLSVTVFADNNTGETFLAIFGSADNDLIQSFGGNDTVSGNAGTDRIEGGTGTDDLGGGVFP